MGMISTPPYHLTELCGGDAANAIRDKEAPNLVAERGAYVRALYTPYISRETCEIARVREILHDVMKL
jgi:hypothetical protein